MRALPPTARRGEEPAPVGRHAILLTLPRTDGRRLRRRGPTDPPAPGASRTRVPILNLVRQVKAALQPTSATRLSALLRRRDGGIDAPHEEGDGVEDAAVNRDDAEMMPAGQRLPQRELDRFPEHGTVEEPAVAGRRAVR